MSEKFIHTIRYQISESSLESKKDGQCRVKQLHSLSTEHLYFLLYNKFGPMTSSIIHAASVPEYRNDALFLVYPPNIKFRFMVVIASVVLLLTQSLALAN